MSKAADVIAPETDNTEVNVENEQNDNTETDTQNNVSGPSLPGFDPALLAGLELEIVTGDDATKTAHKGRVAKPAVIDPWWAGVLGLLYTKMTDTVPAAVVFKGTAGEFRKHWNGKNSSKELWIADMAAQGISVKVVSDATDDSPNALLPTTDAKAVIHRKVRVLPA